MTIQAIMREVQRLIGDEAGAKVSKELLLVMINSEVQKVGARWPNTRRKTYVPDAASKTFDLADVFEDENMMKIQRVLINGYESVAMKSEEIERLVQP